MSQFKKLPIVIEATQITKKIRIKTREGILEGYPGDWLLTGIEGEQYPCGGDIFRKTYHPSGEDKCSYCAHEKAHKEQKSPCDAHEVCMFKWKEDKP